MKSNKTIDSIASYEHRMKNRMAGQCHFSSTVFMSGSGLTDDRLGQTVMRLRCA